MLPRGPGFSLVIPSTPVKKPTKSAKLFQRAKQVIPGGVNSPVRAFKAVGGSPHFIARAAGSQITDVDGNSFIDYVGSWGPMIHGHAPRGLTSLLSRVCRSGTSFGAPSPLEVELAEQVRKLVPSMDRVRFVSSGTEATMSAARVARAATIARRSSSSRAAITDTPTPSWCRRALAR